MNETETNKGKGIFYGVIGIATLIVAIIGATFAYFTAQKTAGEQQITGNMASISFGLKVDKVVDPGETKGLIPMSNSMVEQAVNGQSSYQGEEATKTCIDDMGNAVCQIYKVTVTNTSSTTMFVDGYVALKGGSGKVTDFEYDPEKNSTTMRWAQVFKSSGEDATGTYSTGGTGTIGGESSISFSAIDKGTPDDGFNKSNILDENSRDQIVTKQSIGDDQYDAVSKNYIRVSEHELTEGNLSTTFDSTNDVTSLLVLNRRIAAQGTENGEDKAELYFVVWLSETGNNQTAGATPEESETPNPSAEGFFNGIVSFVSAQGGKVTASFSGYSAVEEGATVVTP